MGFKYNTRIVSGLIKAKSVLTVSIIWETTTLSLSQGSSTNTTLVVNTTPTTTLTYSLKSGSVLPAGLTLTSSGVLSGIPTGNG